MIDRCTFQLALAILALLTLVLSIWFWLSASIRAKIRTHISDAAFRQAEIDNEGKINRFQFEVIVLRTYLIVGCIVRLRVPTSDKIREYMGQEEYLDREKFMYIMEPLIESAIARVLAMVNRKC